MKFSRMSDEETCGARLEETYNGKPYFVACSRTSGHKGECISLACDAGEADGVCFSCREPLGQPHHEKCFATT